MKKFITLDTGNISPFVCPDEIKGLEESVLTAKRALLDKSGAGSRYLGWVELPENAEMRKLEEIVDIADGLREEIEAFLVLGIGGSYLGAKAVFDALGHSFFNGLSKESRKYPQVYFGGQNLSGKYIHDLIEIIRNKKIAVNVISKSGTTLETAVAFRIIKKLLEQRHGKASKEFIIATTDASKGALKKISIRNGYRTFVIPDDVGGRFSVLTPVGLFPLAVAGIDVVALLQGASDMAGLCKVAPFETNPALMYACIRNVLYKKAFSIEILASFMPSMTSFGEWWKQLFGESEGKEGRGIFPAACTFTTDLHSLGQYIQEGRRNLFETFILADGESVEEEVTLEAEPDDPDGLNYLAGKSIAWINRTAERGVAEAHKTGGVPNMSIHLPELNAYYLGQLIYFFEFSCGVSGYVLGVNPFDQPGVEAYKKNMFELLGKK